MQNEGSEKKPDDIIKQHGQNPPPQTSPIHIRPQLHPTYGYAPPPGATSNL